MKKYILVLIPLLIFWLADSARLQEKPATPDKDKTEKSDDSIDEMFGGPISKEEGRKIFEKLSKEEKEEIIKRWKELKKLPEAERKKALDNFYRLLQGGEKKNGGTDGSENETTEPPKFSRPEVILSNILYMSFYSLHRDRNEKHMRLIFAIQKEDPYFFYKMKFLDTQEQRYELLIKTRDEMFEKDINTIAKKINLDDETKAKLKQLLKKQRDEEDKLEVEFVQKQMDLWNEAYSKMTTDEKLFSKIKNFLRIFQFIRMQPPNPDDRGPKPDDHGRREMHGQEGGFMVKHTVENWKSTIEKLELSEEKTKKLIDGYKELFEKFSKSKTDMEARREFKTQLDKLIDETLTKEEKDKLVKLFGPGAFRNEKGPHREKSNHK